MINFRCPTCQKVQATLKNNSFNLCGNVTLETDFPPPSWTQPFAKCTDHGVFLVAEGTAPGDTATTITANLGGTELKPGDWLATDSNMAGFSFKHHFIYVGNGQFVSRQRSPAGVRLEEGKECYEGKKAVLVMRGGQAAADKARARVGEGGYNAASNNCEHFCSEVCGQGTKSVQALVTAGKFAATVASFLMPQPKNPSARFRFGTTGGFSSGGSFSGGIGFSL